MQARLFLSACVAALLALSGCQQPAGVPATRDTQARSSNVATSPANPSTGDFDYYLFTLSWSPEYCHGHPNNPQCDGSHPGFVVHGLWPQYNNGQWPSQCSASTTFSVPMGMLDIMPDPRLVSHEWSTHGACSGLSAAQYFQTIRKAYASIKIPTSLVSPTRTSTHSADEIKQMFTEANPGMSANQITVSCHNRYLSAVAFCLSKQLQPIACQAVRDCDANSIRIPASQVSASQ